MGGSQNPALAPIQSQCSPPIAPPRLQAGGRAGWRHLTRMAYGARDMQAPHAPPSAILGHTGLRSRLSPYRQASGAPIFLGTERARCGRLASASGAACRRVAESTGPVPRQKEHIMCTAAGQEFGLLALERKC
eukprot:CAMPEP_0195112940 /NCGR_PEP_ID=MMETSP0448-20130528/100754_1 /TAXON_ID=66468 /ORGANISM="Heterocapsa triquestra, Strain CCMP 448" /LENGTH=132 /DNA_ID=CAMNT_0040149827 /DNA_START=159 /DNA_END=554 /DNA_ORIENTATION=+